MFLHLIEFLSFRNDGHGFMLMVTVMNDKPADYISVASNARQERERERKIEEDKDLGVFGQS